MECHEHGLAVGILSESQRQIADGNRVLSMTTIRRENLRESAGQGSARLVPTVGGSIGRKMLTKKGKKLVETIIVFVLKYQ